MSRRRLSLLVLAGVVAVAIPVGASSCAESRETAELASQEFRMRITRGAYAEIIRSAAPEFQTTTTEVDFAKAMDGVKERLGPWQSSEEPVWKVFVGLGGRTVTLIYNSHFERGAAIEEFVWRVRKGQPALAGYRVKSPATIAQ